jgi:hypothetical protein
MALRADARQQAFDARDLRRRRRRAFGAGARSALRRRGVTVLGNRHERRLAWLHHPETDSREPFELRRLVKRGHPPLERVVRLRDERRVALEPGDLRPLAQELPQRHDREEAEHDDERGEDAGPGGEADARPSAGGARAQAAAPPIARRPP